MGEEEKPENARGGVVHVKSSWSGEEEVYVASGNHFSVAHRLRECVFMCVDPLSLFELLLSRGCARVYVRACTLGGVGVGAWARAFACACDNEGG